MLKFDFSKKEYEDLKSQLILTELESKVLDYRMKEYSITKMSQLENCSESTISRAIEKIKRKISKIL